MACDICGKVTTETNDLFDRYKTSKVKCVCSSCLGKINKHLHSMMFKVAQGSTRRFVKRMKKRYKS